MAKLSVEIYVATRGSVAAIGNAGAVFFPSESDDTNSAGEIRTCIKRAYIN